ncbi:hypothetical protein [Thalassotalea sediminis]|uniref:hypothetical protein n=1 Tax=Thalassotalea sediminis TaxID=1759089 RepID=UPI002573CAD2|nr:hypothetical protein [Thalassotalea sediminis]
MSKCILMVIVISLFSGCKITPFSAQPQTFASYYLWIKSLSTEALKAELSIINQQTENSAFTDTKRVKLALLFALPRMPQHNPYTAKTHLNQIDKSYFSADDLAFVELLSEQLNQQIIALNRNVLTNQKLERITDKNVQINEQVKKLTTQINQLKSIERDIQPQELNQ